MCFAQEYICGCSEQLLMDAAECLYFVACGRLSPNPSRHWIESLQGARKVPGLKILHIYTTYKIVVMAEKRKMCMKIGVSMDL